MSAICYILLGAEGSGRQAILADLARSAAEEGSVTLLFSEAESALAAAPALATVAARLGTWRLDDGRLDASATGEAEGTLFLVAPGRGSPVDLIEAVRAWLPDSGWSLGRIFTVLRCDLAHREPRLMPWWEACIHFSDWVFLSRREGVPNKWLSDFQERFRRLCYPCQFELVGKRGVARPELALVPEARRISRLFDDLEEAELALPEGLVFQDESEDGEESEPLDPDSEEEPVEPDPYLVRLASGRRAKELPDPGAWL